MSQHSPSPAAVQGGAGPHVHAATSAAEKGHPDAPPTPEDIARWLALLIGDDRGIEVRAPKHSDGRKTTNQVLRFGAGGYDAAVKVASRLSGKAPSVYVVMNGIKPNLPQTKGGAKAADIPGRRWLLIDCDPVRPADASSADAEKAAALDLANTVRAHLDGQGWPEPVFADSGNGYHLLYRLDLPADDESTAAVKGTLEALAARFDTEGARVDPKVFDLPRLVKAYGTLACKGENTPERPHRYARVLDAPAAPAPVPADMLRAVAESAPAKGKGFDLAGEVERKRAATEAATGTATKGGGNRKPAAGPDVESRAVAYMAKCEPAISGQNGHSKAFKAACKVGPGFNLPPEDAFRLLWDHFNPRCVPPWSEKELRHKVDEAYKKEEGRGFLLDATRDRNGTRPPAAVKLYTPSADPGATAPEPAKVERAPIEVSTDRHIVLAETLAALPADPDLYTRGNVLVKVEHAPKDEDVARLAGGVELRKAGGSVRVSMVGEAGLSCRLTALAEFYTWVKDKNGEDTPKPAHPPTWLVKAVLENDVFPKVRPLRGVAEVPFPRPDGGGMVTAPGYDPRTGFFLAPSVDVGRLPDAPTQQDAREAAALLCGLVDQFPFATEDDRAVWLAGLLTVIARPAIDGAVPGFAYVGNRAGTGKGKLIDALSLIGAGRPVPCTSCPTDDAEMTKLKVALALSATPAIHLDNIDEGRTYGSGVLDSALTSMTVTDRILGQSKTTDGLELRCCWFLSGNNITPAKDAYRRWLVCNLVTELERPEERGDLKIPDLAAHIRANRDALARAAVVILKAHATAGRPNGGWPPLGSFEQWDRIVRGAVWYATGRDCNATRRQAAEESPERLDRLALLEAWAALPQGGPNGRGVTAEDAGRLAAGEHGAPTDYPALADALTRFSHDGRIPNARKIGNLLRSMGDRNIGGMAFRVRGHFRRSALWHVARVDASPPSSRESARQDAGQCESRESGESVSGYPTRGADCHSDVMVCGVNPLEIGGGAERTHKTHQTHTGDREAFTV